MSGGDAEAPPGPAHLRAREVLATFASDPTYGDLVHDDFDAAAFSNAVIVRDRDGAPGGEGGESHAEATVREVAARAATVEEAIEGHLDESRDKLMRDAKGLAALQRDVEAVEVAAKEVRRRTRAMARKVLVPFEACAAKTKRLRLVFEANRLLRRCQRALFALRRLREKVGALDRVEQAGGGVELRELGAAAALVGDVERLLDDGGEGRLRGLDVLAGEVGFVAATRDRLRATAERSLRAALDGGHLADAAAALGAAYELGALDDAVAGALRESRAASREGAAAVLDAEAAPARAGAVAVAGALAASLEAAVTRVARLERVLRRKRADVAGGERTYYDAVAPGGGASLVETHWATILEDCGAEVAARLAEDRPAPAVAEEAELAPEEEEAAPAAATDDEATAAELDAIDAQSAGLLGRAAALVDDALERAEDGALALASKTQQIASDVTVETAKATQDLAAKTKDLVEKSKLKLAAKFGGDAAATPAEALAAHYPAVRRAFLALDLRVLEKLAGAASKDDGADALAAAAAADDELPAVDDIDPTNDGGLLPLQHLPPDADYLGAAAKDAPPRSVVALFEAQFLAVNAEHDAGRYGPPAAGAGAASALATALAAPLRPGDVRYDNLPVEAQVERCDEVVFGNRLEMALSRHHVAPTVGRSYGPCPDNPWRTFAGAPKALAGADFTPGAVARARAKRRGPRGEGHEAAAGSEPAAPRPPPPPAAVASAPAVAGRAVGCLAAAEARYVDAARRRVAEPAALMFPELEGYEAAVPSKHDVAFMVDVALKEVRAALDDEPGLAPAVLRLVGGACEAFAARCGRALKRVPAARSAGFRTLGAAVDDACRGGVAAGDMVVPEVAWRASAVEERDARLVACAATLRRQAGDRLGALGVAGGAAALAPGLAALDGLGEAVAFRGVDAASYRVAVELAAYADGGALGALDAPASPALVRALAALSGLRNGYFAALPCWPSPATESPPCRAALPRLAARVARAFVSQAALLRDVDDAGRAALARDVARLDDALVDYEPEDLPEAAPRRDGGRALADERGAVVDLRRARGELALLKRLLFAEPRAGEPRPRAILREGRALLAGAADGRDGRAGLRPSTVWHHCLAACGHALIPLPDALHDAGDGGDDPAPPAARARALYAARLADGAFDDARADADGARVDREREAWLDVLRCLDTWAQRASASGVSSLGDVYDAIHQDGEVLFDEYKAAVMGK